MGKTAGAGGGTRTGRGRTVEKNRQWKAQEWSKSKPWEATAEDIDAGRIPGVNYKPDASYEARSNSDGTISVSRKFFRDSDSFDRKMTLYHEVGHTVATQMMSDKTGLKPLMPFKVGKEPLGVRTKFKNFIGGGDSNPEEFISDIYSSLMVGGSKSWEPGGNYARTYLAVARSAKMAGVPYKP